MGEWAQDTDDGCRLLLAVRPKSSKNAVVGDFDGRLKLAITAAPVDGKANAAIIKFLAKKLGLPKSDLNIIDGDSSKKKTVAITGLSAAQLTTALT